MTRSMPSLDLSPTLRNLYWPRWILVRIAWSCLVTAGACAQVWAQVIPSPGIDLEQISSQLEADATIETRLDVDFDGDGRTDTVLVTQSRYGRRVLAIQAHRDDGGHRLIGTLELSQQPLVPVQLSYADGLISIVDLTGDDTATQVRYQFKFDRQLRTLRLAALDVGRYSRKRRHDSVRLNWDPGEGRQSLAYGKPAIGADSENGYRYGDVERTRRAPAMLTMEQTPTGDEVLAQAGVKLGKGGHED